MSSGRKTLGDIERSIERLHEQERRLMQEMEADNNRRLELLEERTRAYRELAEMRALGALADGVINEADQISAKVAGILKARQKTVKALNTRASRATTAREKLLTDAEALRVEIDARETELDAAADKAREHLKADPAFKNLVAARDQAAQQFEKADAKTARSEEDRKQKGKAYETDPLFMYLWKRRYRSDDYRPNAIVRMIDGWIADYIGYHEARANYAVLIDIPERLRDHCNRLQEKLDKAQAAIDEAASAQIEKTAGKKTIDALAAARQKQERVNRDLDAASEEVSEIARQLNTYAEGLDPAFQNAVDVSTGFLEHTSYNRLLREARRTDAIGDDDIVERIAFLTTEARKLEQKTIKQRRELDRIAERREDLLEMAGKFRRRRYDDDRFEFEPDDFLEDLFEGIVAGMRRGGDAWFDLDQSSRWRGRSADPFRRSSGFPPFGRGGFSGGWGGRSGSGGGGFKTGGGF